jgi:WD40 repeat protein
MGLDFSPDGKLLAVSGGVPSRSGEVKIFNTADGSLLRNFEDVHADEVNSVAFSSDGEYLGTASADKYVKKFAVATGKQLAQFEGHTSHVLGVAWRADGGQMASAGADASINTWNAATGDRIVKIEGYTKQLTAVRYIGQSPFIVSTSGDGLVRMHNADNGGVQRNFAGPADYMYAIDVTPNPDNGVIVAGGHDGVLRIWNTANAQSKLPTANFEARNPKQTQNSNARMSQTLWHDLIRVWSIRSLRHLNLFQIWCFGFRISIEV